MLALAAALVAVMTGCAGPSTGAASERAALADAQASDAQRAFSAGAPDATLPDGVANMSPGADGGSGFVVSADCVQPAAGAHCAGG